MIKGEKYPNRLKVLLLFGDNQVRFEKEIINGFSDRSYSGNSYDYKEERIESTYEIKNEDGDTETEVAFVYFPKHDLLEYIISVETDRALDYLISDYEKIDDYSKHQWIFARILKCYLLALNLPATEFPYKAKYIECFTEIVKKSIFLYEDIFGPDFYNLRNVKHKLQFAPKILNTGFKVKSNLIINIINFTNGLITKGFIEPQDSKYFKEFLKGNLPSKKIDWKKNLRFLTYLINQLITVDIYGVPKYLSNPPKQQWKNLDKIFSFEHSPLPHRFNAKFNKLGKKPRMEIDSLLLLLINHSF